MDGAGDDDGDGTGTGTPAFALRNDGGRTHNLLRKADKVVNPDPSILISKVGWEQDEAPEKAPEKAIWMALKTTMEMELKPEHLLSRCVTMEGRWGSFHQNFQVR